MLGSIATGLIALCLVLAGWVTVQLAWRRAFPATDGDPDALAGRLGCAGSCVPGECIRSCPDRATDEEEER